MFGSRFARFQGIFARFMKPSKDWGTPAHRGFHDCFQSSIVYFIVFCYVLLFFRYVVVFVCGYVLLVFLLWICSFLWKSGFEFDEVMLVVALCLPFVRTLVVLGVVCVYLWTLCSTCCIISWRGILKISWSSSSLRVVVSLEYNWLPDLWALNGCFGAEGWLVPSWCPRDDLYNIFGLSVVI